MINKEKTMRDFKQTGTKEIKKALQSHFNHPFSVRKDRGTASHWIQISWKDGPSDEAIRSFCSKFNDTSRDDIMTDLWCGSQYTSENRENSVEAFQWAVNEVEKERGIKIKVTITDSWRGNGEKTSYINSEDDFIVDDYENRYASQLVNIKLFETDFRKIDLTNITI